MGNKDKGNENKIILEDFNCTKDKMDKDGGNKTQIIYICCSNYALPKPIVDNECEDLWRTENPGSSEFTYFDRASGIRSRIERVYTDINTASNIKAYDIMVSHLSLL